MAHYARISNDIVTEVIVAEQDFIDTLDGVWLQTSYNTKNGEHLLDGTPLRMNYAGIGFSYNKELDAFIPPKPYNSWLLDESICDWIPPIPKPDLENYYVWDEANQQWNLVQEINNG